MATLPSAEEHEDLMLAVWILMAKVKPEIPPGTPNMADGFAGFPGGS